MLWKRWETIDVRQEMGEKRWETINGRKEMGDNNGRKEMEDKSKDNGKGQWEAKRGGSVEGKKMEIEGKDTIDNFNYFWGFSCCR